MNNSSNTGGNTDLSNLNDTGYDPFKGIPGPKLNITFEESRGRKIQMVSPVNITVYQLLSGFFQKVGLLNPTLQRHINFIFGGGALNRFVKDDPTTENGPTRPNNKKINAVGIGDGSKILVLDRQNLLGA